jgi:KTSC domain
MKDITGSSTIEAIGHEDGKLSVRFKGGAVYDYEDFPANLHLSWIAAHENGESAGKFFHRWVKPFYEGKKRETQ